MTARSEFGRMTVADMYTAAEWLEMNEGDAGELESCRRVGDWLRAEADRRQAENAIRKIARDRGVSPALVRRAPADHERRKREAEGPKP